MQVSFDPARDILIARPVGRVDESSWEEFGAMLEKGVDLAAEEALDGAIR